MIYLILQIEIIRKLISHSKLILIGIIKTLLLNLNFCSISKSKDLLKFDKDIFISEIIEKLEKRVKIK